MNHKTSTSLFCGSGRVSVVLKDITPGQLSVIIYLTILGCFENKEMLTNALILTITKYNIYTISNLTESNTVKD